MLYNLITILGPTAVGKTRLAALLANKFNGEIISADSRQVYRKLDLGTGKDFEDYLVNGNSVKYHLIDVIDPGDEFNLFLFNKMFYQIFSELQSNNKLPFLVGGTGLFLHSVLSGYNLNRVPFDETKYKELESYHIDFLSGYLKKINPRLHNTTDLLIKERVIRAIMISEKKDFEGVENKTEIKSLTIGIKLDREFVKERITARLKQRLENGMIDEVSNLLKSGITFDKLRFWGLEYRFIGSYLKGELNYEEMFEKLNSGIHNFAKRQMTWFRKIERDGIEIIWIDGADYSQAEQVISGKYFS